MNKEIKSLTGIRGIAALWVVSMHYYETFNFNKDIYISKFISNGFIAVDVFFLLSAFVMCLAYDKEFSNPISLNSYKIFMKKRFIRIYPAYFFWVFMCLIFNFIKLDFPYLKILLNLLLIQNLFNDALISIVFWSLSAEWILYLIFPFLYYVLQKNKNHYLNYFFIGICIAGMYILPSMENMHIDIHKGLTTFHPTGNISVVWGINSVIRCFLCYVIGINSFLLIKDVKNVNDTWVKVLESVSLICVFVTVYWGKSAYTYIIITTCSILLIMALYLNRAKKESFFTSNIVYFLGKISYSIYLCHMFVLVLLSILAEKFLDIEFDTTSRSYILTTSFILLIPVSYLSYRLMEIKAGLWLKSKIFPNINLAENNGKKN